jgi:hypothetical protein
MAKVEFTQILVELDKMEKEVDMTQAEAQSVEAKLVAQALDEDLTDDLNEMEAGAASKSATVQSDSAVQRLKAFLRTKNLSDDVEKMDAAILCQYLRYFYSALRTTKGEYMSPATLVCIRAGIQRYLGGAPVNRPMDIIRDTQFRSANNMLKVVGTLYLRNGGRTRSYRSIQDADLQKLSRYFDRSGPQRLQEEVAYNVLYYYGERGREAFQQLDRERSELVGRLVKAAEYSSGTERNVHQPLCTRNSRDEIARQWNGER